MDIQRLIIYVLGGLGIFLFGIVLMGDSLKNIAGSKMKRILEKATNTPIKGIILGVLVTSIIQSSSGTTAIAVGLIRAGLMTLPQAVGVMFGASIGTTVTSILIGLNINKYALVFVGVGSILMFFGGKKKTKSIAGAILGFGLIFYGLDVMGDELVKLTNLDVFKNILQKVSEVPILGFISGIIMTAIVQSSSATIGILQQVYSTGNLPIIGAMAIVLGDNVGTTVTALLSSIGGNTDSKRAAFLNTIFKFIGAVIFMIFLYPYSKLIAYVGVNWFGDINSKLVIAIAHISFNLVNVSIMYWFINKLVKFVTIIIPGKAEDTASQIVLEEDLIRDMPVMAIENAKKAILTMGKTCFTMFDYMYNYSFTEDNKNLETGISFEETIDNLDKKIHDYLVKISEQEISGTISQSLAKEIDTIRDFERIGDHLNNILEFFEERYSNKIFLFEDAQNDLKNLYDTIKVSFNEALEAFEKQDKALALSINNREAIIDDLCRRYRKRHIQRLNNKECQEIEDGYYVDILSNVERIGDHLNNIAVNILQENYDSDDIYL